jgi:O-antigen ligase
MFLPVADLELFGFLDYTKSTAVPLIVFAAILVFDGGRLARLRLRLVDAPMLLFCVAPSFSSLSNGLGLYDALSGLMYQLITWGLPYLAGRLYCSGWQELRRLALALLAAGLIYAPLSLWEIRMSPQLHVTLYGFRQHDWMQTLRGSGYRPMVFMHHGLMLGLWMTAASLAGLAVWASGAVRRFWGFPLGLLVAVLVVTTVLCKSFGAIILLVLGGLVLLSSRVFRSSLPLALLLCLPTLYVAARISGDGSGTALTQLVSQASTERASSLAFRIEAEDLLLVKAMQRPVFGWGGWGRNLVRQSAAPGQTEVVTLDSLWILVLGKHGLVGLASLLLVFLVPVLTLWRRIPPRSWAHPDAVFAWALALVLSVYAIDSLVNAMQNPVYLLIAGGLCGLAAPALPDGTPARTQRARRVWLPPARAEAP